MAYAPYGEDYADSGTLDLNFTGQNQDTVSGLYDFMFREYHPVSGRWIQPDPAGMGAVSMANPQSWNRYAYVSNGPTSMVDVLGLEPQGCKGNAVCPDNNSGGGGGDPFWAFDVAMTVDGMSGLQDCYAGGVSAPCDFVNALVSQGSALNCTGNWQCNKITAGQIPVNWDSLRTFGPNGSFVSFSYWVVSSIYPEYHNSDAFDIGQLVVFNGFQVFGNSSGPTGGQQQQQPDPHTHKYSDYFSCVVGGWGDSKLVSFLTADLLAAKAATPLARTGTRMISGGRFSPAVQATAEWAFYVFAAATAFYTVESAITIRSSCTAEVYGR